MTMRLASTSLVLLALLGAGRAAAVSEADLLRPEEAFRYDVTADGDALALRLDIADGYYLYRKRFAFESLTEGVSLGEPAYPPGEVHEDEFFGESVVFRHDAAIRIPYTRDDAAGPVTASLRFKMQGCADAGLCYPPQTLTALVELPARPAAGAGANVLAALRDDTTAYGGFLPVDEAFRLTTQTISRDWVEFNWAIAEGYYLYRHRLSFDAPDPQQSLGAPLIPDGERKTDEYFGEVEVYHELLTVRVPVAAPGDAITIAVGYQGCAEDGICYPPETRTLTLDLTAAGTAGTGAAGPGAPAVPVSEQDRLAGLIRDGALPWVVATFFGFGLLLAFTPCVLPMVPILSSIIVGSGRELGVPRAFALSLAFVLAMALTYTVAGVIVAMLGQNLQAAFQHPAILIGFATIFVALSLSMFGVYELQVPASLQTRLSAASQRQEGGTVVGASIMGVLSALIVGPCVAAPLAATLIVIGQSGDVVRGGVTLFALSLGMGTPLLLFGASAGKLLPKAGAWMNLVKAAFGVLLLGVAIWMIERIVPPAVTMFLWAALLLGAGLALLRAAGTLAGGRIPARAFGLLVAAYGALLAVGGATGAQDPLRPLAGSSLGGAPAVKADFTLIKTTADLDAALARARDAGRPAMLDFYADWCVDCKKMERYTFTEAAVVDALAGMVLLKADVTANDDDDQALLRRFEIFGPPTIAFFDLRGEEIRGLRQIGFAPAEDFSAHVRAARDAAAR